MHGGAGGSKFHPVRQKPYLRHIDAGPVPLFKQQLDGFIGEGEYDTVMEREGGRFILAWTITEDRIHIAMSARTTGWVAVGFDPIVVADNADMVFGWVDDQGRAFVVDTHSLGLSFIFLVLTFAMDLVSYLSA